jgi:hypothetical protein
MRRDIIRQDQYGRVAIVHEIARQAALALILRESAEIDASPKDVSTPGSATRIGSGAAVSRNSHRLRAAAASPRASRSQLSNRCTPS